MFMPMLAHAMFIRRDASTTMRGGPLTSPWVWHVTPPLPMPPTEILQVCHLDFGRCLSLHLLEAYLDTSRSTKMTDQKRDVMQAVGEESCQRSCTCSQSGWSMLSESMDMVGSA